MTARYVGLTSTFDEQRQVINAIAEDVDTILVGFITSGASGSNLTGIVTYITAGAGISITQSTGNVTIAATGGGGGGTQNLNTTLGYGNTSSLGMSVGISTFNSVVVGGATTALIVNGNARITGILTLGTASIQLVAQDSHLKIGTGVSIHEAGNATYSGIVTAPAFYGNGSNLTGVVTSITAGAGISITQSAGNVTIGASESSNFSTPLASNTAESLIDQVFKFQYSVATAAGTISTIQSGQNYGHLAFTNANEIVVSSGSTLHVSSGTTFKLNFLNIF